MMIKASPRFAEGAFFIPITAWPGGGFYGGEPDGLFEWPLDTPPAVPDYSFAFLQ